MTLEKIKLMPKPTEKTRKAPKKLAYWRSSNQCFSIDFKGIITEVCEGDLGYADMDRMDGVVHAVIGCKQKDSNQCQLLAS